MNETSACRFHQGHELLECDQAVPVFVKQSERLQSLSERRMGLNLEHLIISCELQVCFASVCTFGLGNDMISAIILPVHSHNVKKNLTGHRMHVDIPNFRIGTLTCP